MTIRRDESNQAAIEWRGGRFNSRTINSRTATLSDECGTIHTQLATKMIQAHGGDVVYENDVIRALLPLSNS
jgi:hypothetical protein